MADLLGALSLTRPTRRKSSVPIVGTHCTNQDVVEVLKDGWMFGSVYCVNCPCQNFKTTRTNSMAEKIHPFVKNLHSFNIADTPTSLDKVFTHQT